MSIAKAPLYLVLSPCWFERKGIFKKIISNLVQEDSHLITWDSLSLQPIGPQLEALNTRSLFGSQVILIVEGVEQVKTSPPLLHYLSSPNPASCLIMGASTRQGVAELRKRGEPHMVIIDLTEEKPWEKKERLKKWLQAEAHKSHKRFEPDGVDRLIEGIGLHLPHLFNEVQKLICYVGERTTITSADVQLLCAPYVEGIGWPFAEGIIWGEVTEPPFPIDSSSIFSLVGQLRYHLQLGVQLAVLAEKKIPKEDFLRKFPTLRSQSLGRYLSQLPSKPAALFHRGLHYLFELEGNLKSTSLSPSLLFDQFLGIWMKLLYNSRA